MQDDTINSSARSLAASAFSKRKQPEKLFLFTPVDDEIDFPFPRFTLSRSVIGRAGHLRQDCLRVVNVKCCGILIADEIPAKTEFS